MSMPADPYNSEGENKPTKNVIDHTNGPAPIDRALTDLHNNVEDVHQMINDLEVKIFPILGIDLVPPTPMNPGDSAESENSRVHDAIRGIDARVVDIQDRLRSLTRRVEV